MSQMALVLDGAKYPLQVQAVSLTCVFKATQPGAISLRSLFCSHTSLDRLSVCTAGDACLINSRMMETGIHMIEGILPRKSG